MNKLVAVSEPAFSIPFILETLEISKKYVHRFSLYISEERFMHDRTVGITAFFNSPLGNVKRSRRRFFMTIKSKNR